MREKTIYEKIAEKYNTIPEEVRREMQIAIDAGFAVAVALFGTSSPAALATTVGVLTEVPVMLTLVKIANKLKEKFKYE